MSLSQSEPVPWWQGRLVSLDLETTDKVPDLARIVTATIVSVGGGEPMDTWTTLIDPGVEIPEEAASIHGITTERARAEGKPAGEGVPELIVELVERCQHASALIVFNARYDLTVADREARRYDVHNVLQTLRAHVVDPLVVDKHLDKYLSAEQGRHNLTDACRRWELAPFEGAHDATIDAIQSARLAYRLATKGRVIRKTSNPNYRREAEELKVEWEAVKDDVAELHAAQRRWATVDGLHFAEYLQKHDAEADDVLRVQLREGAFWPVIPLEWDKRGRAVLEGQGVVLAGHGDQLALM